MNRLWVRLSVSYGIVLLVVLTLPILLFTGAALMMARHSQWWNPAFGSIDTRIIGSALVMFAMATLFSAFVGVIAGMLVSRSLSKQVDTLVVATRELGANNLDTRVPEKGVDELRDLAASFNRMASELESSQQVRRNLLADVSHELLTPLTVLEGNLRAMLDGVYALNTEEISYLYDQTHHLIGLVKELRQLTQAEAHQLQLQPQQIQVNDTIREAMALFEPLTDEKNIALLFELDDDLPLISADNARLRQILGNLLANALRHTSSGGEIKVESATGVRDVRITVADNGDGFDPADAAHVFDRFYRADNGQRADIEGSGLGLAIVKALTEAHGGSVSAESDGPGSGSTFSVYFPL